MLRNKHRRQLYEYYSKYIQHLKAGLWNQYSNFRPRCQAKFLTSRRVRMRKLMFYICNALRKLMIRA